MWFALKRLSLGVTLIALAAGVLLASDWGRRTSSPSQLPRIALLQHASQAVLDEGVQGMLAGLAEMGFRDGETVAIHRFNAENDLPTANAIAKEMVSGPYDLLLTASTLSLQTVAKANQSSKIPHVFGLVTDPFGAGVGISRENPLNHPPYLVGYGTFQPVEEGFRLARDLLPTLESVGVVWNPGESNSEANVVQARKICRELGITLLEATVDNSSGVFEAASSLVSRGAQALWVGGDVMVLVAIDAVINAARHGRIPVFTSIPPNAERGALFDLGANYFEVGRETGRLAGRVLKGEDPSTIPVANEVPEKLVVNREALAGLRDTWRLPDQLLARADVVIGEREEEKEKQRGKRVIPATHASRPLPIPGRVYRVGIAYFGPDPVVESGLQGFLDGLRDLGFIEGKNLFLLQRHAQGDIVNIPAILQSYLAEDLDLIVPMTTPVLTATAGMVKKTPAVFTVVYDPVAAGAGTSPTEHLPTITGVGSFPPVEETVTLIQRLVPEVQAVGTLYNASEANSRKVVGVAREFFQKKGIALEEVAISNSSEVFQAAQALATREIQALWITGDNTALQAFEGIAKVAEDARLPLVINDPEFMDRGALACAGLGFYRPGYEAAEVAARVLTGENPATIPFQDVADRKLCVNFRAAQKLGLVMPSALLQEATYFTGLDTRYGGPARIRLVLDPGTSYGEDLDQRLGDALQGIGLIAGRDYVLETSTADGRESAGAPIPAGRAAAPDLVVVSDRGEPGMRGRAGSDLQVVSFRFPDGGDAVDLDALALEIARRLSGVPESSGKRTGS